MSGGGAGQQSLSWSSSSLYRDVVAMGKNNNKTMTTKCDERGREAGAPANLTQQPTKEQEGRDGATSGGGAGETIIIMVVVVIVPQHRGDGQK